MNKMIFLQFIIINIVLAQPTTTNFQKNARNHGDVACTDSIEKEYFQTLDDITLDNKETGGTTRSDVLYGFWRICGKNNQFIVAQEIIKRLINDSHYDVRRTAATLIPLLDKNILIKIHGVSELQSAIHDKDARVRYEVARNLIRIGQFDTNEILDTLKNLVKNKLEPIKYPSRGCLQCIKNQYQNLKLNAIKQINKINNERAKLILNELANDSDSVIKNTTKPLLSGKKEGN